jgi:prephenate dehydrogenase
MIREHIKMPEKICIAGLGQMGASLALALKHSNSQSEVIGWAHKQTTLDNAIKEGIIDSGSTDLDKTIGIADLTVLCLPVEPLIELVKVNAGKFKKGSIVTDISSVKSIIVDEVRPPLNDVGVHFIGSHPMAGNEKSGLSNSSAELYNKAIVFICSYCTDDPAAINIVREFWRDLKAKPYEVDAIEHDNAVASTSHMLHITSSVATHIALEESQYELAKLACAGSFRDTSRIAASCPKMWRDITKTNKTAVLRSMDKTIHELEILKQVITDGDWDTLENYLAKGRDLRDKWWSEYQELKK